MHMPLAGDACTLNVDGDLVRHLRPDEHSTAVLLKKALLAFERGRSCTAGAQAEPPKEEKCLKGIDVAPWGLERLLTMLLSGGSQHTTTDSEGLESAAATSDAILVHLCEGGQDVAAWLAEPAVVSRLRGSQRGIVAVMGDQDDLDPSWRALLLRCGAVEVSLGPQSLLASHCCVALHHWLDRLVTSPVWRDGGDTVGCHEGLAGLYADDALSAPSCEASAEEPHETFVATAVD